MGEVRRIAVEDAPSLEELLAAVEGGDTVDLVRGEQVVARVGRKRPEEMTPEELVADIKRLRCGLRLGPDMTIRDLLGRDD